MTDTPEAQRARGAWVSNPWDVLAEIELSPLIARTRAEREEAQRGSGYLAFLTEHYRGK